MRNFWPLVLLLLLKLVGSCCLAWQDHQGEQGPKTALEFDPIKQTLSSLTDFAGKTTRYIWTRPFRELKIIPSPGTLNEKVPGTAVIEYDPYGRLRSAKRDALQLLSVTYDEESRPKTVRTPDRTYTYSYSIDGELTELEGGDQPIHYSECNVAGKPQTIEICETVKLEIDYFPIGAPRCIVYKPAGCHVEILTYNAHGDLISRQVDHEDGTTYEANAWGAPASIEVQGEGRTNLFDQDVQTLALSAAVGIELDDEGRPMPRLSLDDVTNTYDVNDRLTTVVEGAFTKQLTYKDGLVASIEQRDEILTLTRDDQTRVKNVTSSVRGQLAAFVYDSKDRVVSYTDPKVKRKREQLALASGMGVGMLHELVHTLVNRTYNKSKNADDASTDKFSYGKTVYLINQISKRTRHPEWSSYTGESVALYIPVTSGRVFHNEPISKLDLGKNYIRSKSGVFRFATTPPYTFADGSIYYEHFFLKEQTIDNAFSDKNLNIYMCV